MRMSIGGTRGVREEGVADDGEGVAGGDKLVEDRLLLLIESGIDVAGAARDGSRGDGVALRFGNRHRKKRLPVERVVGGDACGPGAVHPHAVKYACHVLGQGHRHYSSSAASPDIAVDFGGVAVELVGVGCGDLGGGSL